jgi:hypothetical protein
MTASTLRPIKVLSSTLKTVYFSPLTLTPEAKTGSGLSKAWTITSSSSGVICRQNQGHAHRKLTLAVRTLKPGELAQLSFPFLLKIAPSSTLPEAISLEDS